MAKKQIDEGKETATVLLDPREKRIRQQLRGFMGPHVPEEILEEEVRKVLVSTNVISD